MQLPAIPTLLGHRNLGGVPSSTATKSLENTQWQLQERKRTLGFPIIETEQILQLPNLRVSLTRSRFAEVLISYPA